MGIESASLQYTGVNVNTGERVGGLLPRRGTSAAWSAANPVLMAGEIALDTDTGAVKMGDGVTTWNSLPMAYATPGSKAWLLADLMTYRCFLRQPFTLTDGSVVSDTSGTYDATKWPPISAPVKWSDGTDGVFTGTYYSAFPALNAYTSYSYTYVGTAGTRTVTQPAITRNPANGAITTRPALVFS